MICIQKLSSSLFPLFVLSMIFLSSCATYRLKQNLSPENKEFFNKVRYIITKQEKKIFLHLPPDKRDQFITEFWKKRDPEPQTEKNEFKEKYYNRIQEANHLFKGGSTPGWLQDRGRVYILLGPPDARNTYPRGYTFYGKPMEIWYYGFFPVIFIDQSWNRDYKLAPQSAYQISQMNEAQMQMKPKVKDKKRLLDFEIQVSQTPQKKPFLHVKIPYRNIWFEEKKNKLHTTLDLTLNIRNSSGEKVYHYQKSYPLSIRENNTEEILRKSHSIKVPLDLKPGDYKFTLEIENNTDQSVMRKEGKFQLKSTS